MQADSLPAKSLGKSPQKHWSGLPFLSSGDLCNLGIETGCPALQADSLQSRFIHVVTNISFSFSFMIEKYFIYVYVLSCSGVSCSCNPMGYSPLGSSVHGISKTKILKWAAIPFSRGSSQPGDWTCASCIAGRFFTIWVTWEAFHIYISTHTHKHFYLFFNLFIHWWIFRLFWCLVYCKHCCNKQPTFLKQSSNISVECIEYCHSKIITRIKFPLN